jgi:hypothetical protein
MGALAPASAPVTTSSSEEGKRYAVELVGIKAHLKQVLT